MPSGSAILQAARDPVAKCNAIADEHRFQISKTAQCAIRCDNFALHSRLWTRSSNTAQRKSVPSTCALRVCFIADRSEALGVSYFFDSNDIEPSFPAHPAILHCTCGVGSITWCAWDCGAGAPFWRVCVCLATRTHTAQSDATMLPCSPVFERYRVRN